MKFLLIAALIALATASPASLPVPGPAGPAPVVDGDGSPISDENSPAYADHLILDESPVHAEPVIIDESSVAPSASPLVQIIINVKSGAAISDNPVAIEDPRPEPEPPVIADAPEAPAEQPIIANPAFPAPSPGPAVNLPQPLN